MKSRIPKCKDSNKNKWSGCVGFKHDKKEEGIYTGEFKDGVFHGHGIFKDYDGHQYAGQWENGKRHGLGVLSFANGGRIVGQWENDQMNGIGVMTKPDGSLSYFGEYKSGKLKGLNFAFGERSQSEVIFGEMELGIPAGHLTMTSGSDFYIGETIEGLRNGYGFWVDPDWNEYSGEFRDGVPHGEGTMSFREGKQYSGEFKDGEFIGEKK